MKQLLPYFPWAVSIIRLISFQAYNDSSSREEHNTQPQAGKRVLVDSATIMLPEVPLYSPFTAVLVK